MKIFTPSHGNTLFSCVLFFLFSAALASPHHGTEMLFKQPDGRMVKVKVYGDEYYQRVESIDGYTLIRNEKGWICYASLRDDKQEFISTDIKYNGMPVTTIKKFPALLKGISLSSEAVIRKRVQIKDKLERTAPPLRPRRKSISASGRGTTVDHVKGLAIIIDFADEPGTISRDAIERYFNTPGYNEYYNNGSVRDYYMDVSGGLLDYSNVVTSYYRAKYPKTYYDSNTIYGKTSELLQEAYEWLDQQGFDFSTLTTQDGEVRAVNFYYAGYPTQGWTYGLWPHMSYYSFYTNDGVRTGRYQMTNIGSSLTLATTCHENGHMVMGWPDLYDYGYDGVSSAGLGVYCLMAYQGPSNNPVPPNAYLRSIAGWENVMNITSFSGDVSLVSNTNNSLQYDNASNPNEYFIIESRTKTGRSASLPDEGMMIWHIDQGGYNEYQDMTSERHFQVSLEQADGLFELEHGYSYGGPNDLFGANFKNSFNDFSLPDANWWNGIRSNLSISQISAPGSIMTAKIGEALSSLPAPSNAIAILQDGSFKITWQDNSTGEAGFKIERKLNADAYQIVGSVGPNTTTFIDNNNINFSGVYTYRVYAYSASGASPYSNETSIQQTQGPYGGYPASLTAIIEAENFDIGGEGVAYHDVDANNIPNQYRTEGVDIENCSEGGYSIGYIRTGEWLEYTVSVPFTDYYELNTRIAANANTGKFHIEFDGVDKTGIITVPSTGGWQNWSTIKTSVYLTQGLQTMRLYADGYDFNLNNFTFNNKPIVSLTAPADNSTYNAPANITITADATDPNGSISKVEFYKGSSLLGTSTTYPYTFMWNNVQAGIYTLKARAYDSENAFTDSQPILINVNAPEVNNLALNKPVTFSSAETSSLLGPNAVDGNLNTRWSSAYTDPQYLIVDLGANYTINRVKISWEAAYARYFQIQLSNDNISWTTIKDVANNTSLTNDLTNLSGTGRYVKMYGINRATSYGYSIYEFEVYGSATTNQVNVAYKKAVTTSSNENSTLTGDKSVDVDGNTRWSSSFSEPQYMIVDLGSIHAINRIKISWEVAYAKYFQLQTSNDNVSWTTIKDVANNTLTTNEFTGLSVSARYVKIYCINRATSYGFSIYELEVYGLPAASPTFAVGKSIDRPMEKEPTVYPNPAKEFVKVEVPPNSSAPISISIINALSQIVLEKTITTTDAVTFNTRDFADGIYIISVQSKNIKFTKRLVIKS
jgi:M6 family metalloprotease-like protein